jgi:signal transduction histidine kinase
VAGIYDGDARQLDQGAEGPGLLSGGSISIAAEADRAGVSIHVQDTGSGIAPIDQARIFEPFFRGQAMRRFPQGMGLGLTIAQDVVTAHGGHIDFTSAVGQGTRFTIWLPLDAIPQ